ncbi:MAG: lipopolysaccharide heptosyltransferase II [Candidatus Aenigmatarchaeota archaeon]
MFKWLICKFGKFYFSFIKKVKYIRIEKIAIIKSGAIGDILMTTPFVRTLRKNYPDAEITYITGDKFKDILKGNKNIDRIITFDTKKLFDSNIIKRFNYFRKFANFLHTEKFDLCFILDKSYLANLFAYWCKIPVRIGFDRNGEGFPNTYNIKYKDVRHEILYYLDLLKPLNITYDENDTKLDLFISKNDERFASNFLRKNKIKKDDLIIGVAPASTKDPKKTSSLRIWSSENYAKVIEKLVNLYNAKVILFGSKEDVKSIKEIQSKINVKTYNSAGITKIKQAAALIKRCRLFITHDCGLMHIASAMDVIVISIFGPTDPRRKAPLNKGSIYLWKDKIKCERCEIFGKFPYCKKHVGTDSIKPEDVLRYIDELVNN